MANICINKLTFDGPQEDIERFYAGINACETGELSIMSSYLPPPKFHDKSAWMTKEGVEWQNQNWGSKHGDYDANYEEFVNDSEPFTAVFLSSWTPCNVGFIEISKKFPTLTFHVRWIEPGNGLFGTLDACNGMSTEVERDVTAEDLEEFEFNPKDFVHLGV